MVWIPGGDFLMGSDDFYPEERPAHRVGVDGFWMDAHPVTVAEFRRFVKATGLRDGRRAAPDPAEYPDADPELLVPGSLVFTRPTARWTCRCAQLVELDAGRAAGAIPKGPGSTLHGRERHPVTHVAYADARAYCSMGGQGAADGGRVGACRARRARGQGLLLG